MSRPVTVLLMDDARTVRTMLAELLRQIESVGRVIEADDAPSALRLLKEFLPDVAVLDIQVPGDDWVRNGIDVLRHIKQRHPRTKVLMLSNHATAQHRLECMRAGADRFFDKSSEIEELLDCLAQDLGERKAGASGMGDYD